MNDSVVNVWPQDVPTSLWSYHLIRPEQRDLLPLMGMRLEWDFVFAFLFGAALVALFAWQRFSQPSFHPDEFDYEVVKKLAPTQLRGGDAMRRAYFYYAGILVAVYAALTFFGGLIFKAVNYIPMAGLEVDIGRDTLTSPSWPLTLAIGMAGFAPLLRPVEIVETWLRRQVHGWAGVPMQLKERTRRLLLTLDQYVGPIVDAAIQTREISPLKKGRASGVSSTPRAEGEGAGQNDPVASGVADSPLLKSVSKKLDDVKPWMRLLLRRSGNFVPLIRKWSELEIMTAAIKDPGSWPDTLVLDELQPLVREQRLAAGSALLALEDLIDSVYPEQGREAAEVPAPNQNAKDQKNAQNPDAVKEAQARQRRQLETILEDTVAKIDKSRLELAAILAVYAERSPYLEEASISGGQKPGAASSLNETLKVAVMEIAPPEQRLETGFWVLIMLPPIFCAYALMTRLGLHSPLTDVELTAMTVFATAALETLQVAVIFWLPLLAVMALKQYLTDIDRRQHLGNSHTRRQSAERMIYYIAIASVVAALGLMLVAMFWMALIAENPDRFRDLLYMRKQSAFATMIPKSLCAGIFAYFVVRASEREVPGGRAAIAYGAAAAALTVSVVVGLNLAWLSGCLTDVNCTPWESLADQYRKHERPVFYRIYNLTDAIVCFILVFVAVTNAGWRRTWATPRSGAGSRSVIFVVSFAIAFTFGSPALSDQPAEQPSKGSLIVRAGFRSDAEPFSYRAGPIGTRRYRGYAADLCYSIFAGSGYVLKEVPVTASDRFNDFRTDRPDVSEPIDILCDPTTLRYWRNNEVIDGYFSPIIFVTGVSYIVRSVALSRAGTDLAYVENTTAEQVALRACNVDFFGVASSEQTPKNCSRRFSGCSHPPSKEASKNMPFIRLCSFLTYDALTEWFCKKGGRQQVYFGDREIIQAKFNSWRIARGCEEQDVERFSSFYTYEPYALLVSRDRPELARFVQRRIYDFFSHREKAVSLFTTYFPGVQMSPMMANLILLNGIDEPMYETVPSNLFSAKQQTGANNCRGNDPCR
ncbi:hypothetical protein BC374_16690 [Ensifer sp. LC13]|uniref:hypothetical protein n=1 Tax=unclassified Ensifer TaxID=2633371 RepID=UPI0008133948|nr:MULTISPECIES: hypothetical protein [unclassified Ensifer]OCP11313.1 hypothetical protein BC374_16690 [Ensifer sp. LC13]OCP12043.1 hypothetical protein BBX50_17630 [Ensifer sp. LC11]OCP33554.1 hypothetical protein BC364_16525 [Ensifer sp. LC499]